MKSFTIRCLTVVFLPSVSVQAASLAYYQADNDLTAGAGAPTLNGTASGQGSGSAPTFVADVPGSVITQGVGGATVNASNTHSLSFVNPGLPGNLGSNDGGKVVVPGATIMLTTFTIEGFIKASSTFAAYSTIFSYNRGGSGSSWMLDTEGAGGANLNKLRLRMDTQGSTGGSSNQSATSNSPAINDNTWHHVALSYDGSTGIAKIYFDYNQVLSTNPAGDLVYEAGNNLNFGATGGGRGFNGLMDEIRLSNTLIPTSEFLRAVPEPSSALLGLLGGLSLLRRKR